MSRETITIHYDYDRWGSPWIATFESYDGPESPIGAGSTQEEALDALLDMAGVND